MTGTLAPSPEQREIAGRYRLERVLGRGGMGTVHLARDQKLGTWVALKLAHAGGASQEVFRARFAREARIGHRLGRREGFVRALDWGEAGDGQLYLVMDLVEDARPLGLGLERPLDDKLRALVRAARLVAQAHEQGVVHRDLKPTNLLETPDGQVFLADFGLARVDGEDSPADDMSTAAGVPLGTPAYMPPEQFADAHAVDARADVYALGVMLFQALTGELPFTGLFVDGQRAVTRGGAPAPRARDRAPAGQEVAEALDLLCAQALALDVARRIESARSLADGLVAAAALGPSDAAHAAPAGLELEVQHATRLCFAMERCGLPVVDLARVTNRSWAPIEHAVLRVALEGQDDAAVVPVPALLPGDTVELDRVDVRMPPSYLRELEARRPARLSWWAEVGAHVLARGAADVQLLAADEWPGEAAPPQVLAVFVTPAHPVVERVVARARERLAVSAGAPAPDASGPYARGETPVKERARAAVCAVHETLASLELAVTELPEAFVRDGARVRSPDRVLAARAGTPLDLTLLWAACLEALGLHPLVVVGEGLAVAGAWLQDDPIGLLGGVAEDAARLRTLRALDHVVLLDPGAPRFDEALARGERALDDDRFRFALDVHALRDARYGYRPLPASASATDVEVGGDAPAASSDEVRRILAEAARAPVVEEPAAPRPAAPPAPARFRRWQDRLLDLTLRNKLLAFSLKGRASLGLEVPDLPAFEDRLARGEAFDLAPRPVPVEGARPAPVDEREVRAARLADLERGRLQVGLLADELVARGRHLISQARTGLEEGGANVLFVAVGLLRWVDDEGQPRLAPLVLYPAALELDRRRRSLRLRRLVDEDPVGNATLREKMRQDHGLDLSVLDAPPHDEHGLDVRALLAAVREAIRQRPGWEVLEEAHLGLFTFTRFLMWRDLRDHQAALLASDVVSRIATARPSASGDAPDVRPETLDATVDPAALPLVLDADATQTAAIVSALRGRNFVLQGPPGTGKSQTITNLIAAALAAGETVLFVSEKMAALEVVHRRLEAAGLGDFCLELHSHKASKKNVLRSLGRALDRAERQGAVPWAERSRELARLRDELNAYVRALHAPRLSGRSFHETRARLLELQGAPALKMDRTPDAPGRALARRALELTGPELEAMSDAVAGLVERARVTGPPREHPFRESDLREWSEATQRAIREGAEDLLEALGGVDEAARPLLETVGAAEVQVSTAGLAALAALARAASARPAPAPLLRDDAVARAIATEAEKHAAALDAHAARRAELAARWTDALFERDLAALAPKFEGWKASWGWVRWFALGGARKALAPAAKGELPDDAQVARDLPLALEVTREAAALKEAGEGVAARLEGAWEPASGAGGLRGLLAHARDVRRALGEALASAPGVDPAPLLRRASGPDGARAELRRAADDLARAVEALDAAEAALKAAAAVGERWPLRAAPDHRAGLGETCARWLDHLRRLREWCFYNEALARARELDLELVVRHMVDGRVALDDVGPAFERWILERWVEGVRDHDEVLRRFEGPEHHRRVASFAQQDAAHLQLARRQVAAALEARLPAPAAVVAEASELGRLRRELKKQRGHLAVRQLLRELPELFPRLKPCVLMSPLSVAQFLPADARKYDLVVFDEASQIPTHEAIGAMARGDQVVVVGDSRQLPPTTFFQRAGSGDDESASSSPAASDDEAELEELESVLDEAVASQLPEQTLGWHYRSRHESLIEFSNRHYYDERLTIFPAASAAHDVGVRWHHVPDGVYLTGDGAGARTNRPEAEALVRQLVASLVATPPGARSFGVVTFNRPQQELIEELLDEARGRHPELEAHFQGDEPVFVKNLENVQGDERDEVLFSVTYAKDPSGRLRMHFGPLSIAGGERRLNVAITRARRQLRVFSTLTADQIDLSRTRARGTEHLRLFLDHAARHGSAPERLEGAPGDGIKGAFERAVHVALRERGYEVRPWVGCGRYRVDLGVIDPRRPGEYLLGVECDGPMYRDTPTARDRDRLRRQVLEDLGWRMHRVWLLDWTDDRERELARLDAALAAAVEDAERRAAEAESAAASPRPPVVEAAALVVAAEERVVTPGASLGDQPTAAPSLGAAPTAPPVPRAEYRLAPAQVLSKTPEDLFAPESLRPLFDRIEAVVEAEAPLHLDVLVRRVLDAWSWSRVTPRARARVLDEGLEALTRAKKVDRRGDWAWRPGQRLTAFRTGGERKAEHLPPEEVALAARWLLEQNVSLGHDDLVRETAKVLGFSRLGSTIAEAMRAGIRALAEEGGCVIDGDRVRLA